MTRAQQAARNESFVRLNDVNVSATHVQWAIDHLDQHPDVGRHQARLYQLIDRSSGKRYPAKHILSLAQQRARGNFDFPCRFSGGEAVANRKLRRLGFQVERIGATIEIMKDLIDSEAHDTPAAAFDPMSISDARERIASEIVRRRGQPTFRKRLMRIYSGRCVISGSAEGEVLEACHILPYRGPSTNHPSNGLLLRADLHILFDLGLITIDSRNMQVEMHPSLRTSEYFAFHGKKLPKVSSPECAPNISALDEHRASAQKGNTKINGQSS
jgi:hypothetical protein